MHFEADCFLQDYSADFHGGKHRYYKISLSSDLIAIVENDSMDNAVDKSKEKEKEMEKQNNKVKAGFYNAANNNEKTADVINNMKKGLYGNHAKNGPVNRRTSTNPTSLA